MVGNFSTKGILSKNNKKIGRHTKRMIGVFAPYKFKQRLMYMGSKYNSVVTIVNEYECASALCVTAKQSKLCPFRLRHGMRFFSILKLKLKKNKQYKHTFNIFNTVKYQMNFNKAEFIKKKQINYYKKNTLLANK